MAHRHRGRHSSVGGAGPAPPTAAGPPLSSHGRLLQDPSGLDRIAVQAQRPRNRDRQALHRLRSCSFPKRQLTFHRTPTSRPAQRVRLTCSTREPQGRTWIFCPLTPMTRTLNSSEAGGRASTRQGGNKTPGKQPLAILTLKGGPPPWTMDPEASGGFQSCLQSLGIVETWRRNWHYL